MDQLPELLRETMVCLQNYYVVEALIVLGGLLLLIDYYFLTDWPAHIGYMCIAAAFFFVADLPVLASLSVSIGVWLVLSVLHRLWFRRFLQHAPQARRVAGWQRTAGPVSNPPADVGADPGD